MKPYETTEDLENRIIELEKALYNARQIRYQLRSNNSYQFTDLDENHFQVFEDIINREIDLMKFHIELEKILIGE